MKKRIWKRIIEFLICLLAMTCLLFAGSDSPYFPWPNFAAAVVFAIIVMAYLRRHARRDILTWFEQRQALKEMKDLNTRLGRLNDSRMEANRMLNSRIAAGSSR
jgi:hypothetical protein